MNLNFYKQQTANKQLKFDLYKLDMKSQKSNQKDEESEDFPFKQLSFFIKREKVIKKLQQKGIKFFFPIQYQTFDAINYQLDLIGRDRTGSGKTIAYSLPVIERFRDQQLFLSDKRSKKPKLLIILPTRQLVIQVAGQIEKLKIQPRQYEVLAVYGGGGHRSINDQIRTLNQGVDIVVSTTGRLLDLLKRDGINFSEIETICLDEADEMLKQGFDKDIEEIYQYLKKATRKTPQNLLFSATMPKWVQDLSNKYMTRDRKYVNLIDENSTKTSQTIEHLCCECNYNQSLDAVQQFIQLYAGKNGSIIIFCETKVQTNDLFHQIRLHQEKHMLHGDIAQENREATFKAFRSGKVKCLIATDVAARGLDIPSVDLIIQMQPPQKIDTYVHRSGRTGRAGKNGVCLTFYSRSNQYLLSSIQSDSNIQMRSVKRPQQTELVQADIVSTLKQVKDKAAQNFKMISNKMIQQMGAEKALSLALAYISEFKKPSRQPSRKSYIKEQDDWQNNNTNQSTNRNSERVPQRGNRPSMGGNGSNYPQRRN